MGAGGPDARPVRLREASRAEHRGHPESVYDRDQKEMLTARE
jgi:hypothetical protein